MNETKVSVIILSYNTRELLKKCLESVVRCLVIGDSGGEGNKVTITQPLVPSTEIIVVDNGSTDGSVEMVKSITGIKSTTITTRIKLIENKANFGFARGNNQVLRYAQGKLIFFLNSDTIVKNGAIDWLVNYLENHPVIAAVSPLLLNEDGSIQKDPCYLNFPSPLFVFVYYNRILKFIANNLFPRLIYSTLNFSTPNEVAQLPGAALMIRKEVFEKAGGFDEKFSHFFNDVDLCYRLKKSGYKLFLVPEAKIIHFGRKSLLPKIEKEGMVSFYYLNFKSLFAFCEKNYSFYRSQLIKFIVFCQLISGFKFKLIKNLLKK